MTQGIRPCLPDPLGFIPFLLLLFRTENNPFFIDCPLFSGSIVTPQGIE